MMGARCTRDINTEPKDADGKTLRAAVVSLAKAASELEAFLLASREDVEGDELSKRAQIETPRTDVALQEETEEYLRQAVREALETFKEASVDDGKIVDFSATEKLKEDERRQVVAELCLALLRSAAYCAVGPHDGISLLHMASYLVCSVGADENLLTRQNAELGSVGADENLLTGQNAELGSVGADENLLTRQNAELVLKFIENIAVRTVPELAVELLVGSSDQTLCPPSMTFLSRHLDLLASWRKTHPRVMHMITLGNGMLRELLLMLVDEEILFLHWDETKGGFDFGQRVRWRGLFSNADMRLQAQQFFPSQMRPGGFMEMMCWTAVKQPQHLSGAQLMRSAHRVWGEGIPNDIASFEECGKVVVFFKGAVERIENGAHTFPAIRSLAEAVGSPLNEKALVSLKGRMVEASDEVFASSLEHQMERGGSDDLLKPLVDMARKAARLQGGVRGKIVHVVQSSDVDLA
uniref:Uncharacterized protein n=1 Tax=Chromera velia CCMP2878 TaxID=1169474 RepID=A0A0G4F976_9ALVE|eukprot:Cvel_15744.t1-p1 / transcript=Cvel_15744.t1 / gene=Cvel_15744 / organism=Chromera_velia_CCMP2878 / gene_product=hypothetical protein / transcript_product=hypothetical protein / location=Cvel_scaffold1178:36230-37630(+) / protein_length=467 / sequence_SO=supercontig / SO=protein_coding / is_pseudo=false